MDAIFLAHFLWWHNQQAVRDEQHTASSSSSSPSSSAAAAGHHSVVLHIYHASKSYEKSVTSAKLFLWCTQQRHFINIWPINTFISIHQNITTADNLLSLKGWKAGRWSCTRSIIHSPQYLSHGIVCGLKVYKNELFLFQITNDLCKSFTTRAQLLPRMADRNVTWYVL